MSEGQEIAVIEEKPSGLVFGTNDPSGIINRAKGVATQVAAIVEQAKLYNMIKDRKYVKAEGWTTMAAMVGIFPSTDYSRRIEREDEIVYEAKVVLHHISGAEVGSGEAICSSKERNWNGRDEYAIKSMAQTRALGKACRLTLSWIMALAGYETVPAEEMQPEAKPIILPRARPMEITPEPVNMETGEIFEAPEVAKVKAVFGDQSLLISDKQRALLFARSKAAGCTPEELQKAIKGRYKKEHTKDLTRGELNELLEWLKTSPDAIS